MIAQEGTTGTAPTSGVDRCWDCGGALASSTLIAHAEPVLYCNCTTSYTRYEWEPDVAEQERMEESQRQMKIVLARQARRAAPVPLRGPQVTERSPRHPHRLRLGNVNRWD